MKRWYHTHELAIWLIIVMLLTILLIRVVLNERVLWEATTPIVNFIGGSNVKNIN